MGMNFNPQRLGSAPTSPRVQGLAQLLAQQNMLLGDLGNRAGNVGKIMRTNDVNDQIASGELNGLSEQEARAKLLGVANGSLTPEGTNAVEGLLGGLRKADNENRLDQRQIRGDELQTNRMRLNNDLSTERLKLNNNLVSERGKELFDYKQANSPDILINYGDGFVGKQKGDIDSIQRIKGYKSGTGSSGKIKHGGFTGKTATSFYDGLGEDDKKLAQELRNIPSANMSIIQLRDDKGKPIGKKIEFMNQRYDTLGEIKDLLDEAKGDSNAIKLLNFKLDDNSNPSVIPSDEWNGNRDYP